MPSFVSVMLRILDENNIKYEDDIPKAVSINEALELTKEAKMVPIYKKLNDRIFALK